MKPFQKLRELRVVLSSPVLLYLLVKFSPGTTTARERLVAQTNITGFLTQASVTAREVASRTPGRVLDSSSQDN